MAAVNESIPHTNRLLENMGPLNVTELRYLRKAVRFRLDLRRTPPSGNNTSTLSVERRRELNALADWLLQETK